MFPVFSLLLVFSNIVFATKEAEPLSVKTYEKIISEIKADNKLILNHMPPDIGNVELSGILQSSIDNIKISQLGVCESNTIGPLSRLTSFETSNSVKVVFRKTTDSIFYTNFEEFKVELKNQIDQLFNLGCGSFLGEYYSTRKHTDDTIRYLDEKFYLLGVKGDFNFLPDQEAGEISEKSKADNQSLLTLEQLYGKACELKSTYACEFKDKVKKIIADNISEKQNEIFARQQEPIEQAKRKKLEEANNSAAKQKQRNACIETQKVVENCIQKELISNADPACVSVFMYYSMAVDTGSCKEEWNPDALKMKQACKKFGCRIWKK